MFCILAFVAILASSASAQTTAEYEASIKFSLINSQTPSVSVNFPLNTSWTAQGCDPNGNWTFIVHGWNESNKTTWVPQMIGNFSESRKGCVVFMDYSLYSIVADYGTLVTKFSGISAVLTKKILQLGTFNRTWCFGFSFGSRLCIDAGLAINKTTNRTIDRMELCDPAGPGFDVTKDPKPAANNVACIDTSQDKGTSYYNCHQNFLMGSCGVSQPAAGAPPMGNHGLCPYFYLSAFKYDFVPLNLNACTSSRMVKNLTASVKMGANGVFNRTLYRGDIVVATAKYPPYLVINNVTDNVPKP